MPNTYDQDDTVRITVEFKDADGNYVDPSTITLVVQDPAGTTTSYTFGGATVTKSDTGRFYRDHVANSPGWWFYRWEGTGAAASTAEDQFFVRKAVDV